MTGLRRSGKTVFITSLIHHLMDAIDLPFVRAVHDQRYRGARLTEDQGKNAFPIAEFLRDLDATPPRWPKATEELSTLEIEIAYETDNTIWRQFQTDWRLRLEIIDYPGEWLLDLPLLDTSFEEFCNDATLGLAFPSRRRLAAAWIERLNELNLAGRPDLEGLETAISAYHHYATRCQSELGMSFIQPGRLTSPGELEGSSLLRFCPVLPEGLGDNWITVELKKRYDRYRDRVVLPFYEKQFRFFDRQIVLVDLLSNLNSGPEYFEDTKRALERILKSFRYGRRTLLDRLFAPSIDRVLFAVSKADHIASNQHPNLKQLLELLVRPRIQELKFHGLDHDVLALAALRSTDVVRTEHDGQMLSCVRGRLRDEDRETILFPGEVPPELPEPQDWLSGRFRFREFAPRRLVPGKKAQHIRLDQAIEYLIGDKLI
ncbi:MAG: YcjX family protein [Pseudomonadota bacterium]